MSAYFRVGVFSATVGVDPVAVDPCVVGDRLGGSVPPVGFPEELDLPYVPVSFALSSVRSFVLFVPLESCPKGEGGGGMGKVDVPLSCASSFREDPLCPFFVLSRESSSESCAWLFFQSHHSSNES